MVTLAEHVTATEEPAGPVRVQTMVFGASTPLIVNVADRVFDGDGVAVTVAAGGAVVSRVKLNTNANAGSLVWPALSAAACLLERTGGVADQPHQLGP